MMNSSTSAAGTSSSKDKYERKLARQRQLDLMEAAASGIAIPSMSLDFPSSSINSSTGSDDSPNSIRIRNSSKMLNNEEELSFSHSPTRSSKAPTSSLFAASPTRSSKQTTKNLFDQRGRPDQQQFGGLNLMDHTTGVYKELTATERMYNNLRSMFGGKTTASTSSTGAAAYMDDMYSSDAADAHQFDDYGGNDYIGRRPSSSSTNKRRTTTYTVVCRTVCGDRRKRVLLLLLTAIVVLCITLVGLSTMGGTYSADKKLRKENTQRFNNIMDHIIAQGVSKHTKFVDSNSAEHHALQWISYSDPARLNIDDPMLLIRYALATFFYNSHLRFEQYTGKHKEIEKGNLQWEGVPNPGWIRKDNWMTEKGVCSWYGIHCPYKLVPNPRTGVMENVSQYNENVYPTEFIIKNNQIMGSIVHEIKALAEGLRKIDLRGNKLSGTIPTSMGQLYNLETLYLSNNFFNGTIHGDFGFMESIRDIDLQNNRLSGQLPSEMNRLYALETLRLSYNNFTGNIPDMIACSNMKVLYFDHNNLNGEFPFSLALHASLKEIYINNNHIKGTIPPEIETIRGLEKMRFESNSISGRIPTRFFVKMSNLREVALENNQLSGVIPTEMSGMTQLELLDLSTNKLAGPIPSAIGTIKSLQKIHLKENRLIGSIPPTIGDLTGLRELWVQSNKLNGNVPKELGKCSALETIFIENNQLEGTIPASLGSATNLKSFRLHTNALNGDIPTDVCNLKTSHHLKFLSSDCKVKVKCPTGCCSECY